MRMLMLTLMLAACLPLAAQWPPPRTGSYPETLPDRTVLAGQVATSPDFGVRLVDPGTLAKQKSAIVEASVEGLELVNPGSSPKEHQGHIAYKVDNGTEMVATSKRIQVANLAPGKHTITVYLAGNDNRPISPEHHLDVKIPK